MESQTLDTHDVTRIETSVQEAVTKIDDLAELLREVGNVEWPNPLPGIRDQLSVGLTALNRLREAHQSALISVKTEETTVKQANEIEKKRLSDKQAELDRKADELKEWERKLDKREGSLEAKDQQLEDLKRELDAREFQLDETSTSQENEKGRLAERETNLVDTEVAVKEQHDEQLKEAERLQAERDQWDSYKNQWDSYKAAAEENLQQRVAKLLGEEERVKKDQETASQLANTRVNEIVAAAKGLEDSVSRSNDAAGGLNKSLERAQTSATTIETKLSGQPSALDAAADKLTKQSSALDKDAGKLAKQSTTVDTISKKLSELDLATVEETLAELNTSAHKLEEKFAVVGSHIESMSTNARGAATVVGNMQTEHVTKLNSALADITTKLDELLKTLDTSVREAEPHTPLSPESEKRKRVARGQRALKRVAQGLQETPADGRPMSSESAEFGAPLPLSAKASEEARPVEPSSSTTVEGAQPAGASSSSTQVPRWINEDVDSEISVIWSKLEFSQPDLWTDADATKFKALLKRFQLKGGSDRPVSKFATCSSQQQNGRETCYECKSASKGNGNFDQGNDNACQMCRAQRKPCFRVTRTGEESKWLITRRP